MPDGAAGGAAARVRVGERHSRSACRARCGSQQRTAGFDPVQAVGTRMAALKTMRLDGEARGLPLEEAVLQFPRLEASCLERLDRLDGHLERADFQARGSSIRRAIVRGSGCGTAAAR